MKTSRNLLALAFSVLAVGVLALRAQEAATLNQPAIIPTSPENLRSLESYSDTQLNQLVNALAATPLIWPTNLPDRFMGGGYWSLAHPNWPPLPTPGNTPFWNLTPASLSSRSLSALSSDAAAPDSTFYLLDDVDFPPMPEGGGGTNVYTPPVFQPRALPTTNDLWLQVVSTTNTGAGITAYITIHPPWNLTGGVWDIFATTSLAPTAWQWVSRSAPGQTNAAISGLAYPNEFFTAASTNDADGDLLSSAYEKFVSHTDENNPDTDGDGIPDGWEVMLDLNPLVNDNAQAGSRSNYSYTMADWWNEVSGIRTGMVMTDNEGNVTTVSQ